MIFLPRRLAKIMGTSGDMAKTLQTCGAEARNREILDSSPEGSRKDRPDARHRLRVLAAEPSRTPPNAEMPKAAR
jgi:hypothetical protein